MQSAAGDCYWFMHLSVHSLHVLCVSRLLILVCLETSWRRATTCHKEAPFPSSGLLLRYGSHKHQNRESHVFCPWMWLAGTVLPQVHDFQWCVELWGTDVRDMEHGQKAILFFDKWTGGFLVTNTMQQQCVLTKSLCIAVYWWDRFRSSSSSPSRLP